MVLAIHSDAGYLNESKAWSRAGGHFFLSSDVQNPPNNGAVLTIAQIIDAVMSSAAEAKLGALFINAKEAVHMRRILQEMGHPQPRTPIQTDNLRAEGVINSRVRPKRTKSMDMRFEWLLDREQQGQFKIYWRPGKTNLADISLSIIRRHIIAMCGENFCRVLPNCKDCVKSKLQVGKQVWQRQTESCFRSSLQGCINKSVMYPGHYPKMVLNIRNRILFKWEIR
jgi:hypothetical protein